MSETPPGASTHPRRRAAIPPIDGASARAARGAARRPAPGARRARARRAAGTRASSSACFQPDAADCARRRATASRRRMRAEGDGFFSGVLSPARRCPSATRLRFIAARRHDVGARRPVPPPADARRDGPLPLQRGHASPAVDDARRAPARRSTATRAPSFAVWAPNAERVSVVGDWCNWDGRQFPMRRMGDSGLWELFIPGVARERAVQVRAAHARRRRCASRPIRWRSRWSRRPSTASIVVREGDVSRGTTSAWMTRARAPRLAARADARSTRCTSARGRACPRTATARSRYREIAPRLAEHVKALGFTHVELLPVMEHPFYGSWGYQVTGYFAPTSRYGTPDDFRFFVDTLHQAGIGVILDWVPAHFPKDDYALRRFDGTALYEHEDPRLGEHPDWGTLIFNYGRNEVRNFLVANALYWLHEFHVDGLRVDAVASMLYLDYSRKHGEWVPQPVRRPREPRGDRFPARDERRRAARKRRAACTIAEDSTAWPGVTRPIGEGGLGLHLQVEHGVDARHARVLRARSDPPPVPPGRAHLRDGVRVQRALHHAALARRGGAHEGLAATRRCRATTGRSSPTCARCSPTCSRGRASRCCSWAPSSRRPTSGTTTTRSTGTCCDDPIARGAARLPRAARRTCIAQLPPLWQRDGEPRGFEWIDIGDEAHSVLSYVRRSDRRPRRGGAEPHADAACAATASACPRQATTCACSAATTRAGAAAAIRWRSACETRRHALSRPTLLDGGVACRRSRRSCSCRSGRAAVAA